MAELWEEIEECSWYCVSPKGEVLNTRIGRLMTIRYTQTGLAMVGLSYNGVQNQRSVARLVAKAWLPAPDPAWEHYAPFDTIIHLNGDKADCRVENLMWRPRWFAIKYNQERKDFPYDGYMQGPFVLIETGEVFDTIEQAAMHHGLLGFPIFKCIFESRNENLPLEQQQHSFPYGYHFGYYDPN